MFEVFQERPQYWDGMPYDRFVTLPRGGDNRDWIKSWQRVARELISIDAAIAYARLSVLNYRARSHAVTLVAREDGA